MKFLLKNLFIIIILFLIVSAIFALVFDPFSQEERVSLNQVVEDINQEKIEEITAFGSELSIKYKDETEKFSRKEPETGLRETLISYGVEAEKLDSIKIGIEAEKQGASSWLVPLLIFGLAPLLLFGVFFFFILKQAKSGAAQTFSFTKAKARLFGAEGHDKKKITFADVAGLKEAKEELKEVVDFLKNPKKYLKMGAQIPRGVLMMGSAGTGKTLLSRATAGEAEVPFFHISGSEFVEMFVGVGASVTHDTPILIKDESSTKLLTIGEFIDRFYEEGKQSYMIPVKGFKTLGYNNLDSKFRGVLGKSDKKYFGNSSWQELKGVYRHKVDKIYEIHYLGGTIKTTGDHSVFIRYRNFIAAKKVKDLKEGDVLVNLPFKVRSKFIPGIGTTHIVKAHKFEENGKRELAVWNEDFELEKTQEAYEFALTNRGNLFQHEIADQLGVSQSTVGLWQREINRPRYLDMAERSVKKGILQTIKITPSLLRLLGYYAAEGRITTYYTQFVFGAHEKDLHNDCIKLMKNIFGVEPHLKFTEDNSLRITYHSKFLATFFEKHCGNGSHNKHIPEFLWDLPKEYFLGFLKGYSRGDGYTTKEKRLIMSSVSKQLILELAWLSSMHGIQVGIKENKTKKDRIIKDKPLPESVYWTLAIGKTSHPFIRGEKHPDQFKKPIIKKIVEKPYNGYVYDLCGCENEAFFGGEKPTLLHNSRVRDLFSTAKKAAPAIIFIDELDAIGRQRGAGLGGGHDEREQTLNQILVEMDGFERDTNIIVLAATNRPDILDSALMRPGRFDRKVVLDMPDIEGREAILKIHCKGKPLASDVNLREVAERTPGFSGADAANVINEAAILAARRNKNQIYQTEILESIEKVLLGPERRSHVLDKKEKEIAAFHEAGHALVSASLPGTEPVRKISIISRGMAAGYTLKVPSRNSRMKTKSDFLADIATFLAGHVAERLVFGEITTGASSDLKRASDLTRRLIKEYGMSSLGPISFGEKDELVFLGKEISEERNYSEEVAAKIDKEIEKIIIEQEKVASGILSKRRKLLEKIAQTLIQKETIEKEEFNQLINGDKIVIKEIPKKKPSDLKIKMKDVE